MASARDDVVDADQFVQALTAQYDELPPAVAQTMLPQIMDACKAIINKFGGELAVPQNPLPEDLETIVKALFTKIFYLVSEGHPTLTREQYQIFLNNTGWEIQTSFDDLLKSKKASKDVVDRKLYVKAMTAQFDDLLTEELDQMEPMVEACKEMVMQLGGELPKKRVPDNPRDASKFYFAYIFDLISGGKPKFTRAQYNVFLEKTNQDIPFDYLLNSDSIWEQFTDGLSIDSAIHTAKA